VAAIICRHAHWGKPLATPGQPLDQNMAERLSEPLFNTGFDR